MKKPSVVWQERVGWESKSETAVKGGKGKGMEWWGDDQIPELHGGKLTRALGGKEEGGDPGGGEKEEKKEGGEGRQE